ncbi:hypothetical protein AAK943_19775, partial [Emergencia timonensis]|uniref:hypothetical protein n=1 Tax=Emergencia timonensis TaxID=1776384 RepID=UPI003516E213
SADHDCHTVFDAGNCFVSSLDFVNHCLKSPFFLSIRSARAPFLESLSIYYHTPKGNLPQEVTLW